ncbi:thiamine pyrophosphate-dependent enzyme [Nitrosopumilus adriaticus]|uniref:thiamine pyrophosphate-dependent enzyme n=1 Tax=Nitrosopumilus adriaticus TaxID=1580092 RepID=UPI00352F9CEB
MIRFDAIKLITEEIGNQPIISANGFISRDLFEANDKESNFYMIGSMGLSSSIGLGVALTNSKKRIFIFDGDGNILMNLGSLITIGSLKPKNLVHVIFDNEAHESTGGQPTNSSKIKLEKMAKSANYTIFKTNSKFGLKKILKKIQHTSGPILILIKIKKSSFKGKRVSWKPTEIRKRFMKSLKK